MASGGAGNGMGRDANVKIRILDLFCGAGGAAKGYWLAFTKAGFEVEITGVDIASQKRYPYTFVKDDALHYAASHGWRFDFIHASPPCQAHSIITPDPAKHVDLIPHTRWLLESLGKPYIIENVMGAARAMRSPIMVCGAQLGLKVYRHRLFESSMYLMGMAHAPHRDNTPRAGHGISSKGFISVTSGGKRMRVAVDAKRRSGVYGISEKGFVSVTGHFTGVDYCRMAMGIDWMTAAELSQAVPPAYTEYLGRQLVTYFQNRRGYVTESVWDWRQYVEAAS